MRISAILKIYEAEKVKNCYKFNIRRTEYAF